MCSLNESLLNQAIVFVNERPHQNARFVSLPIVLETLAHCL